MSKIDFRRKCNCNSIELRNSHFKLGNDSKIIFIIIYKNRLESNFIISKRLSIKNWRKYYSYFKRY